MKSKHYWFGMEWSGSYYLGYNCKKYPLTPEIVFEVCGDINFRKNGTDIRKIYFLRKPKYCQNKPIKYLSPIVRPWKCDNKTAELIHSKWFNKRTPIEYNI